jgi:hypothetical protein
MDPPQYVNIDATSEYFCLNVLLHTSQGYGCYAVRTRSCTFRLRFELNVLLHKSQLYGRSQYVHIDVSSNYLLNWMCFYTHHSYMDAPQYAYIDVSSNYLLNSMFSYTNHSYMDAPQYVYIDVSSNYLLNSMFSYTNHSYMDAPQYVYIDVSSNYLLNWMFFYTNHSHMDACQYVHVCGDTHMTVHPLPLSASHLSNARSGKLQPLLRTTQNPAPLSIIASALLLRLSLSC